MEIYTIATYGLIFSSILAVFGTLLMIKLSRSFGELLCYIVSVITVILLQAWIRESLFLAQ